VKRADALPREARGAHLDGHPTTRYQCVEALQRLRADPVTSSKSVIAITASVTTQDRTRIMAAGFDGFHGKPISVKQLRATAREVLDKC
jgi:CheY-like chemotaxis protein